MPADERPLNARVCYAGRLSEEKNVISVVKACNGTGAELIIAGEGALRDAVMETAREHNVSLHLAGNVPHSRLAEILQSSTLFVLASFHEGHPKTLLEAMACGLPVIGARSPGIRDIISHEENGLLCGTDPASLHRAIMRMLTDEALRRRLGENARKYVLEHCSLENAWEKEIGIYRTVCGRWSNSGRKKTNIHSAETKTCRR